MVKFEINGITRNLGAIRTGHNYLMDKFNKTRVSFKVTKPGRRPVVKTVNVKDRIAKALKHIDQRCALMKSCNQYFRTLNKRKPISLRQTLDGKTLHIYRLKPIGPGNTSHKIPAGLCFSWGKTWAQIGINELVLIDHMETANTLLHELAHVAGAPGLQQNPKSLAAEKSLLHCGMRKYYDPKAFGSLDLVPGPGDQGSALA